MTRGTTPTIKIKLKGVDLSILNKIFITIRQGENELTKEAELVEMQNESTEPDIEENGNEEDTETSYRWDGDLSVDEKEQIISMPLSQEDTLTFSKGHVDIQFRGMTKNNQAIASNIQMLFMRQILRDGVIG